MTPVTVSTSELPEATAKLEIEVSADAVDHAIKHAAEHMAGEIKIPGFREGKVPPEVALQKLGHEAVFEHAFDESVGGWYGEALEQSEIAPIGSPSLESVPAWIKGEPLKFELTVPVRPVAEVGDYDGIEVGKKEAVSDETAVDSELAVFQDRFSKLEDVDRASQGGDFVDINFLGKLDGEPFEGGAGSDYVLELGSGQFIPGFEEQLVGKKAEEDTEVNVTFPADYGAEHLAGQEAIFEVHINSVKEKTLPELTDEFASENLGYDTLQELKDEITQRIGEQAEKEVEQEYRWAVVDAVAKQATIDIPHGHIHSRAHELWHELANSLYRRGIDPNAYLQAMGQSEHDFIDSAEGDAEQTIRREATIAALIEKLDVSVTEDEMVDAIADDMNEGRDSAEEQFKAVKEAGGVKQLENELKARKVIDELVSKAKPIPIEQAEARDAIWTPEKEEEEAGKKPAEGLWTPGS
jgi:trigger factor